MSAMNTEKANELVRLARKTDAFASACALLDEVDAELAALEADNARMRKALDITEHDTKEPIRSIRFYLKLIDDLGSLDEEHAAYLQAAIRSIDGIESALKAALTSKPLDTTNHCPLCEGYAVHVAELEADNARKEKALDAIDGPCERLTSGRCIDDHAYYIGAEFGADAVCYPCIANRALAECNSRGTESH